MTFKGRGGYSQESLETQSALSVSTRQLTCKIQDAEKLCQIKFETFWARKVEFSKERQQWLRSRIPREIFNREIAKVVSPGKLYPTPRH